MGAKDMFSPSLMDFTGISDNDRVHVSDVLQQTFITVDEEGTEAAAASSKYFANYEHFPAKDINAK